MFFGELKTRLKISKIMSGKNRHCIKIYHSTVKNQVNLRKRLTPNPWKNLSAPKGNNCYGGYVSCIKQCNFLYNLFLKPVGRSLNPHNDNLQNVMLGQFNRDIT